MNWHRFQECIHWRLGRGNIIRFWEDEWIDGGSLMRQFLRIFAIAQSKNMVIEEAYRDHSGITEWFVNVDRNLNDW